MIVNSGLSSMAPRAYKTVLFSALASLVLLVGVGLWLFFPEIPHIDPPKKLSSDDLSNSSDGDGWRDSFHKVVLREVQKALSRFQEVPMGSSSFSSQESYRLILLPTFDAPLCVTASRTKTGFDLTTKLLDGEGGYELGRLATNERLELSDEQWRNLLRLAEAASLSSMPTFDREDEPVPDGTLWFIEFRRDEVVHQIVRITPDPQFLEMCRYLLQLSGKEFDYTGSWQ